MKSFKAAIPNTLTLMNLFFGGLGVLFLLCFSNPVAAIICMAAAALFDLLDGMVARLLHATSNIGADLDSLSDVVSFGLLPALMAFDLLRRIAPVLYPGGESAVLWMSAPALFVALMAALRLAKFNNDTAQHYGFKGLPVPANALLWGGVYGGLSLSSPMLVSTHPVVLWVVLWALVLITGLLMVSSLPMYSFKAFSRESGLSPKYKRAVKVAMGICLFGFLASLFWVTWHALWIGMLCYIVTSLGIGMIFAGELKDN